MEICTVIEYMQKKHVVQLNQAIDEGLVQLQKGRGIKAEQAYQRLQKK